MPDLFSLCCKNFLYKGTALSRTIAVFLCINLYIFIPRSFDATVINSFLLFISQKLTLLKLREQQYSEPSSSALTIVLELYLLIGLDESHWINFSLVFILFIASLYPICSFASMSIFSNSSEFNLLIFAISIYNLLAPGNPFFPSVKRYSIFVIWSAIPFSLRNTSSMLIPFAFARCLSKFDNLCTHSALSILLSRILLQASINNATSYSSHPIRTVISILYNLTNIPDITMEHLTNPHQHFHRYRFIFIKPCCNRWGNICCTPETLSIHLIINHKFTKLIIAYFHL